MAKEVQWKSLAADAVDIVRDFFRSGSDPDETTMKKVRVATSVLSSYTRHEQTESARDQTAVVVARELASNKEEFSDYLRLSAPRLAMPLEKQLKAAG